MVWLRGLNTQNDKEPEEETSLFIVQGYDGYLRSRAQTHGDAYGAEADVDVEAVARAVAVQPSPCGIPPGRW